MTDIFLTADGDIYISEAGDISLTDSIRQAARIRLLWFLGEWRFWPDTGVPYFEEILIKNPNIERLRWIIRDEVVSVDGVIDVRNIRIDINKAKRTAMVSLDIVLADETYREEVAIYAATA